MKLHSRTTALFAVMMAATLAGACNKGPDPKDRVATDLKAADIDNVNVDYDRDAGVVHLKGAVDTQADKARAEDIAARAVGTTGKVANELTVKGVNDRTADDMDHAIGNELKAKINNDKTLDDRNVDFDVNNGVVTIKGEVRSAAEKDKVAEMTRSTANVKDIVNELEVNPRAGNTKAAVKDSDRTPDSRSHDAAKAPADR